MESEKYRKMLKDIYKISTPEIKRNLILASLISTAFEIMKYSLIEQPYLFFGIHTYDNDLKPVKSENQKMVSREFSNELEHIRKNLPEKEQGDNLKVMWIWFKNHKVLTNEDIEIIKKIRSYRNEIVHNLLNFLLDSDYEVDMKYLFEIKEIVEKVDVWWLREFTIPTDPEFNNIKIDDAEIKSGRMICLNHLLLIAFELERRAGKDIDDIVH